MLKGNWLPRYGHGYTPADAQYKQAERKSAAGRWTSLDSSWCVKYVETKILQPRCDCLLPPVVVHQMQEGKLSAKVWTSPPNSGSIKLEKTHWSC